MRQKGSHKYRIYTYIVKRVISNFMLKNSKFTIPIVSLKYASPDVQRDWHHGVEQDHVREKLEGGDDHCP